MSKNRVYVPVTTREYAELYGVSIRTAQRRVKNHPGATQVGKSKRWKIPLTASQYAEKKGVSKSTARRRGVSVPSLTDFVKTVSKPKLTPIQLKAAENWIRIKGSKSTNRPVSVGAIGGRMAHASPKQAREIAGWENEPEDLDYDEYIGDDDESILHYHE